MIKTRMSARSSDQIPTDRARYALARHHGISSRQKTARPVPTALAFSEFQMSPCIKSEKLVVMPHEGHGTPVSS
jgi:hypothetical protein